MTQTNQRSNTMGLKESFGNTLKTFARIFPGISDYQDKESLRGQDKVVREHLADLLNKQVKSLDELKIRLIEAKKIELLGKLELTTKKISKLSDMIKHSSYGYSPIFASDAVDQKKLKKIYEYDISLAGEIRKLDQDINSILETANLSLDTTVFDELEHRLSRLENLIVGRKKYA